MLARERGRGRPYVSLLGSRRQSFFTDGGRELFDCAGQGRIDVFFLSGGQIDGAGNINLVSIGDYEHPNVRFPGSFGSSYMYYVVPKVILFRLEHTRRTLVRRSISSARQNERTTPIAWAVRSRSSPIAACSPSIAAQVLRLARRTQGTASPR
jgi:glutaconate CoA-transferase subunit B